MLSRNDTNRPLEWWQLCGQCFKRSTIPQWSNRTSRIYTRILNLNSSIYHGALMSVRTRAPSKALLSVTRITPISPPAVTSFSVAHHVPELIWNEWVLLALSPAVAASSGLRVRSSFARVANVLFWRFLITFLLLFIRISAPSFWALVLKTSRPSLLRQWRLLMSGYVILMNGNRHVAADTCQGEN